MVACALPVPALISLVAALATAAPRSPSFTSDNLANTVTRGAAISGGGVLACAALLCLISPLVALYAASLYNNCLLVFLAVQDSSIGDLVTHSLSD